MDEALKSDQVVNVLHYEPVSSVYDTNLGVVEIFLNVNHFQKLLINAADRGVIICLVLSPLLFE